MGSYSEFENLCLVDTLDNTGFHWVGKQGDLFGVSAENAARIKKQNERKISVIIGNPPYNAKQENYNFQNANRAYRDVDKRIKETYVNAGGAQNQIVLYDMYVRFIRWATDRLESEGMISFVSNNSFVDGLAFDGFRKIVAQNFSEIYVVNLKGNARTAGERRRMEGGNVFSDDIRVGVAVYFLVKRKTLERCRIFYNSIGDYVNSGDKKSYLSENKLEELDFDNILPDKNNNWINVSDNDWDLNLSVIDKEVKRGLTGNAIFKSFSAGIKSQRDEWVFDLSKDSLKLKMSTFIESYKAALLYSDPAKDQIKWDRELSKYLKAGINKEYEEYKIVKCSYRPFFKQYLYFDKHFNGQTYQWFEIYKPNVKNKYIAINSAGNTKGFFTLVSNTICDLHFTGDSQVIPFGSNITPWAIEQFTTKYNDQTINDEAIFHYVYAVLHHPAYRKKYEINLKREFPRIPLYDDFWQWAKWGKALMKLHLDYETVTPWGLVRKDIDQKQQPKAKLKADKSTGVINLDENTELHGVPALAWTYKLGNRSALEWILDQYKEKKPSDPTIAEKFNTYRFADYKDHVVDLLDRVCRVSVDTMEIIGKMPEISPE